MKMRDAFLGVLCSAVAFSAQADVFTDCTAWYIGGKGTVGAFTNGDMTDIRHAAIPDSPTHGGATRANADGISNLCENVYSAASGRTFENQRTIYLAQAPGKTKDGKDGFRENGVTLPFAATNENYTLLLRMKLDYTQPTNKEWVYIADFGYNGGTPKHSFGFRYSRLTEQIGVLYKGGSNSKSLYVTNDVCPTLRGKWLEFSVSLEMLSSGKSRMRFGVGADGLARTYGSIDYQFPDGQNLPYNQKLYLGGTTGYGGASPKCSAARGSYHMISYWERVLTDDEILEAFALQGPDGTAEQAPALLKVGDSAWSADVCGSTIEGTSATPSLDLQDLGEVPLQLSVGQTLNLPFTVPATCTNLRQIVRLTAASASATAGVQVKIDGQNVGSASVAGGQTACVEAAPALFTEGAHTLSLTRTDSGASALRLTHVEISGSWRLGWRDGTNTDLGEDAGYSAVKTHEVTDLTTNQWSVLRSSVKTKNYVELVADLDVNDVATRRMSFRTKPCGYPAQKFDFVILTNGAEVFRRVISPDKPYGDERSKLVDVRFNPGVLLAGRNVFTVKTEINATLDPEPSGSWCKLDYFELEVGTEPTGGLFLLR